MQSARDSSSNAAQQGPVSNWDSIGFMRRADRGVSQRSNPHRRSWAPPTANAGSVGPRDGHPHGNRRRPRPTNGNGQARWRQRPEEFFIGSVVADRDDDAPPLDLRLDSLCHDAFADTPQPHFDTFFPFEDFKRLIAQQRLPEASATRGPDAQRTPAGRSGSARRSMRS